MQSLIGLANPIGTNPAFLVPLFLDLPESNSLFVQLIGHRDIITGFEEIYVNPEAMLRVSFPDVFVNPGDPAIWAFAFDDRDVVVGTLDEITPRLRTALRTGQFRTRSFLEVEIASFCGEKEIYRSALAVAFAVLTQQSRVAAAVWRDAVILLATVRREIAKVVSVRQNNSTPTTVAEVDVNTRNGRLNVLVPNTIYTALKSAHALSLPDSTEIARVFGITELRLIRRHQKHKFKIRLKVGLVGAGRFGRTHALNAAASDRTELVGIYDPNVKLAETVGWEAGVPSMSFAALLSACDAVIIATPVNTHHTFAAAALRAGRHVLVEKPIAATLTEANELVALAAEYKLVLQVGRSVHFSAAFAAISSRRLGMPIYCEVTHTEPFGFRDTEEPAIVDLITPDLELILSLIANPIESLDAVATAVTGEHPDIANVRVRFVNGATATITTSRLSARRERRIRIFSQDGYLAADFANRQVTIISHGRGKPVPGTDFGVEEISWEEQDTFALEHAAFIASVLDHAPVVVDAAEGRRVLATVLAITDGMAASRAQMIASGLLSKG